MCCDENFAPPYTSLDSVQNILSDQLWGASPLDPAHVTLSKTG